MASRNSEIALLLGRSGWKINSLLRDLSLYVHAPARLDPSMAPPHEDTLIAIVPVGHLSHNGDQDWPSMQDEARRQVFRRLATLGITDLEQNIKFEVSYNPRFG